MDDVNSNEVALEKMKEALAKANEEAKTFRLERNELKTQLEQATAKTAELEESITNLQSESQRKDIEARLKEANLPVSFAKYMSAEDIDSQIDELRSTQSFNNDAADKPVAKKPESSAEKLYQQLNR